MKKKLQQLAIATSSAVASFPLLTTQTYAQGTKAIAISKPTGFFANMGMLIDGALKFVMVIAALLVFMYLIWGGIEWITSGGDKGKTESARNKITAAVIGLIVVAASFAILQLVLNFLGFTGGINEVFETIN